MNMKEIGPRTRARVPSTPLPRSANAIANETSDQSNDAGGCTVANPGFPRGWGHQPSGGHHTIFLNFPKNCMKLKEFGPRGVRIPRVPLRSITGAPAYYFGHFPPENCMKFKKFGLRRGCASLVFPPPYHSMETCSYQK